MSEEESKVIVEEGEGETADDSAAMPPPPEKALEIEKMEEQKLKSKFPGTITSHGNTLTSFVCGVVTWSLVHVLDIFQILSCFQLSEVGQGVEDSRPSCRRDSGRARSTLTPVTTRWPSRAADLVAAPSPCWPNRQERNTPPRTVCPPGRAPSSKVIDGSSWQISELS